MNKWAIKVRGLSFTGRGVFPEDRVSSCCLLFHPDSDFRVLNTLAKESHIQAWTSVGVGSANRIVQLVIGGETDPTNLVLVVKSDAISVSPTNGFTETGATNLTIVGCAECANAVVEVQVRGLDAPLARLHVMVLPWVTNSVGIYRVEDPISTNTWNVGGPPAAEIIDDLNRVFRQACVHFALANPGSTDAVTNITYDIGGVNPRAVTLYGKNGSFDPSERQFVHPLLRSNQLWQGHSRIFIFKKQGVGQPAAYEGDDAFPPNWCVAFVEAPFHKPWNVSWGIRHETGHMHGLSVRLTPQGAHHDNGPPPPGTDMLMREGHPNPEPIWMRHQDWWKANKTARDR